MYDLSKVGIKCELNMHADLRFKLKRLVFSVERGAKFHKVRMLAGCVNHHALFIRSQSWLITLVTTTQKGTNLVSKNVNFQLDTFSQTDR